VPFLSPYIEMRGVYLVNVPCAYNICSPAPELLISLFVPMLLEIIIIAIKMLIHCLQTNKVLPASLVFLTCTKWCVVILMDEGTRT
jgi:hypothetical protein